MKKVISLLLAVVLCFGLCACQSNSLPATGEEKGITYTVNCNDGSVRQMTSQEIVDMYRNEQRKFEELLNGATVTGTGKLSAVEAVEVGSRDYPSNIPLSYVRTVIVNQDLRIDQTCKLRDDFADLYNGDTITFSGRLLDVDYGKPEVFVYYGNSDEFISYKG